MMLNVVFMSLSLTVEPGGLSAEGALERIRAARAAGDASEAVVTVKGVNRLDHTLLFSEADHDIRFVGKAGATFSGGLPLTGWRDVGDGVVETEAPKGPDGRARFFDQLWVGGRRAPCARIPNEGWLKIVAATQTVDRTDADGTQHFNERVWFAADAVKALAKVDKADYPSLEVGVICKWSYGLRTLAAYDAERNAIDVKADFPWRAWKRWDSQGTLVAFMNVRSAFDAPGEWFLDMRAGKVRYRLLPGERAETLDAVAANPGLVRLVSFRGNYAKGRPVRNVVFENIAFKHASAETDGNGPHVLDQHQAASSMPGALAFEGVNGIVLDRCEIAHTAGYGLRFASGCVSNRITNCRLQDVGSGGIWMGAVFNWKADKSVTRRITPPTRPDATAFNLISNNVIECGGRYNPEGTGVALTHCSDTKVVHNDIRDFYYSGVSVGWVWGFTGSVAQRNEIAWNRISDLGKRIMSDMGGVYTLGTSFGTTVHDNIVHDVHSFSYGGWALYCDEGSEGIVMERNLCWNTTDGGFHQHYGTGCVIRNNVFAFNDELGAVRVDRDVVQDIPCTLHFVNNIVYVEKGPLVGNNVRKVGGIWANNVWYDTRGVDAAKLDRVGWEDWVRSGKETGSVFADPLFVNAKGSDFSLRSDSPALRLGFRPFDLSAAGARLSER